MTQTKRSIDALRQAGISIFSVAASTLVLWTVRPYLHKAHFGLVYLLVVATVAASRGTQAALLAAVLSFLAWNYFLIPPFYTFTVADPLDWLLLFTFLAIAALIGHRTGHLQEREAEAIAREKETAALYKEKLKSVLLSSLSHNLKTPLASLTATLSNLEQEDIEWDKKTLQDHLTFMAEDVNRLTEYIDNLLSLAQLESDNWEPKREGVELTELVSTALRHLPENDYHRIQVEIPETFPFIWVDFVQISQVIRHLVENALTYAPSKSKIKIRATAQENEIEFWIEDQGPGIPISEREQVFHKFYRGEIAIKQGTRGTGLGLAICHEIVQAHQGTIQIQDALPSGARVRVMLPTERKRKNRSPRFRSGRLSHQALQYRRTPCSYSRPPAPDETNEYR